MVWNKPSDEKSNSDPWSKKNNKSEINIKKNKKRKIFFFDLKYIFSILKQIIKNYRRYFNVSKNTKTPIIIVFSFILLFLFFSGFYIVKETEQGVVLNLGKFSHIVSPGVHWRPIFINNVKFIDVGTIREIKISNLLLNAEEKLLNIAIDIEYKITDVKNYLFSTSNPDESVRQIINGTLYNVIRCCSLKQILIQDNYFIKKIIKQEIEKKIKLCTLGIKIIDIDLNKITFPKEVKSSFYGIKSAYKNKKEYINMAKNYAHEVIFLADSKAKYILKKSKLYKMYKIAESRGNIVLFFKILNEYRNKKNFIFTQMYIKTIENILSHTKTILLNKNDNKILLMPFEKFLEDNFTINLYPNYFSSNNVTLYSFLSDISHTYTYNFPIKYNSNIPHNLKYRKLF